MTTTVLQIPWILITTANCLPISPVHSTTMQHRKRQHLVPLTNHYLQLPVWPKVSLMSTHTFHVPEYIRKSHQIQNAGFTRHHMVTWMYHRVFSILVMTFSMKSVTDWGSIMPVIQSWTVIPQMERVHRIIIQANVVLQNFKNMRKNSVLEILRVWKFLNLPRRYPMTTLYYLLSDRVPTTILPVSLQDISQQLQMREPYTT